MGRLYSRFGREFDFLLDIGSTPRKQGKSRSNKAENADFAVLDLTLVRIVNDADCRPLLNFVRSGRDGAIAQLGERVVRNDEVGGSIPPGSTTLRLRLRVAQPRKSRRRSVVPGEAHRAKTGR